MLVKGKSLDAPAPPELTNKLDSALGKPPGSDKDLKYKDVLRQSEGALAQHGEKVSVTVNANPDSCHVTYRAISGGGAQDFGDTLVKKSVDPKTYEFVCKCTDQLQPKKVVDCTEDQNLDFDCKR